MPEEINILEQIEDLSDLVVVPYLKMGVFGEPGVGKTTFACTFPNPLLIDIDAGALSVFGKHVDRLKVTDTEQITEIYDAMLDDPKRWKTAILDTVSELQMMHLSELSQASYDRDTKGVRDPYLVDIDDYGRNTQWLRRMVRAYRNLEMHIVMVTHEVELQDQDKVIRKRPALTPKFAGNFLGYFDIIGYIYINYDTNQREMIIKPTKHLRAKYRIVGADEGNVIIPDVIVEPTFERIMDVVYPGWRKLKSKKKPKSKKKLEVKSSKKEK